MRVVQLLVSRQSILTAMNQRRRITCQRPFILNIMNIFDDVCSWKIHISPGQVLENYILIAILSNASGCGFHTKAYHAKWFGFPHTSVFIILPKKK